MSPLLILFVFPRHPKRHKSVTPPLYFNISAALQCVTKEGIIRKTACIPFKNRTQTV